jgi:CRP/FNR family transcriptional regulator
MLATLKQTAELVELFRSGGRKLEFNKGDYIIHPGELPPGVFYIHRGLVKAFDITRYGDENLLSIRREHELFPLIWAITGQERQVIFQALAPTTVWRISRPQFVEFMQHHPDALAPLLDMTIEMYRLHSERIINLEYRTVRERIISFLLTMGDRFGVKTNEGLLIEVPLKGQDVASSVNTTRETASREITALERKGLLVTKQSLIILKDLPALEAQLSR